MVVHFIKPLKEAYRGQSEIKAYLKAMQKDILENLDIFLEESEEQVALAYAALDKKNATALSGKCVGEPAGAEVSYRSRR